LIAINPFRPLPLYTPSVMQQYLGPYAQNLPPHPFEISRRAYHSMLRNHQNQAILISGESGAGKTESTKLCLSFFSEAAGSSTGIEQKILSANPILEAFGNAKTLRNNNSSRFGKFMNLSFDLQGGMIVGCGTTNYLLEKSRVHKQALGERSYHIFYQLSSAIADTILNNQSIPEPRESYRRKTLYDDDAPSRRCQRGDLMTLSLTGNPEDYHYLLQSGCTTIPNVSDFDQFMAMENACIKLGLKKSEINDIYFVCAAILHLGNIQFVDNSNTTSGGCQIDPAKACLEGLNNASKLMGLSAEEISLKLRTRELILRGEVNSIQNTAKQAVEARDAFSKMLYKRCFDWLVERTNLAMIDRPPDESKTTNPPQRRHIGILDIFGFEIFDTNGFEQVRPLIPPLSPFFDLPTPPLSIPLSLPLAIGSVVLYQLRQ
jgi:myosin heavy subunit